MRILLTIAAIIGDALLILACHEFAQGVMQSTPYQLWPLAAILLGYSYMFAGASVVLALIFIYATWTTK